MGWPTVNYMTTSRYEVLLFLYLLDFTTVIMSIKKGKIQSNSVAVIFEKFYSDFVSTPLKHTPNKNTQAPLFSPIDLWINIHWIYVPVLETLQSLILFSTVILKGFKVPNKFVLRIILEIRISNRLICSQGICLLWTPLLMDCCLFYTLRF